MNKYIRIAEFVGAALVVAIIGGFAGWFVFVRGQISNTQAVDAARGFTTGGSAFGTPTRNGEIETPQTGTSTGGTSAAPEFWEVSKGPIAGFGFLDASTTLRYAERATGNVLTADPNTSAIARVTNTLFPKTYEAYFAGNGNALLRGISSAGAITTFAGSTTAGTSTDPGAPDMLDGAYLPQNISALAVRGTKLFYVVANPAGGAVAVTSSWNGAQPKEVAPLGVAGWRASWSADGTMFLAQNPADSVQGVAVKVEDGSLTPVIAAPGLEFVPASGSTFLWSSSQNGAVALFASTSSGADSVSMAVRTFADKCAFVPRPAANASSITHLGSDIIAYCGVPASLGTPKLLDLRAQGAAHTVDTIWKVDVTAGTAEEVYAPPTNHPVDVEHPAVSADGAYLAFDNAADESLWMLRLPQ